MAHRASEPQSPIEYSHRMEEHGTNIAAWFGTHSDNGISDYIVKRLASWTKSEELNWITRAVKDCGARRSKWLRLMIRRRAIDN